MRNRLPAMYGFREFVDAGGLLAYGVNVPYLCRRAAVYVPISRPENRRRAGDIASPALTHRRACRCRFAGERLSPSTESTAPCDCALRFCPMTLLVCFCTHVW
jgi:hypothetical protein